MKRFLFGHSYEKLIPIDGKQKLDEIRVIVASLKAYFEKE